MIQRALISVSDKTGILEFSQFLVSKNIEILSTGGTAKLLKENGVAVTDVSDYTEFPELMNGRVKTLHPKIAGGILAMRGNEQHEKEAKENNIPPIDLVVVNLYPFEATLQKEGVTFDEAIENIDIGGPSLLRAAAKNFNAVTAVIDTNDYVRVQQEIEKTGDTSLEFRGELAAKVFIHTTQYDSTIANFLYPDFSALFLEKKQELRYGENPHQNAVFYGEPGNAVPNITNAHQHQGKELSFNNIMDADAAFELVKEFQEPAVAIIKHAVPCGAAIGKDVNEAYDKAYAADTKSPFGGVVAMNQVCDEVLADKLTQLFLEIVIAPSFTKEALEILKKKEKLRVLETGGVDIDNTEFAFKKVSGGLLVQEKNHAVLQDSDLKQVSKCEVSDTQKLDMLFAWKIVKHVKSNAIVLVKNGVAVGIGAGQTSRVDAVEIACKKAGDNAKDSVMASDAFFPFSDGIEVAIPFGVSAIIHPGGSIRDKEVEAKVDELGLGMIYCGQRAFLH